MRRAERARRRAVLTAIENSLDSDPIYGAEIGVWKGDMSALLLQRFPPLHMMLVDAWSRDVLPKSYQLMAKHCIADDEGFEQVYRDVCQRFAQSRVTIRRESSLQASTQVRPGYLDFAIIDAAHDYSSVLMDCMAWWRNVRQGGVLLGDDYASVNDRLGLFCVHGAVDFFAMKMGREVAVRDKIWRIVK